ncbi:MAG: IS110 family transposase [Acidobacteria bacterium]|nr:IS110 family transposase [Acidobacteriota bacterium]
MRSVASSYASCTKRSISRRVGARSSSRRSCSGVNLSSTSSPRGRCPVIVRLLAPLRDALAGDGFAEASQSRQNPTTAYRSPDDGLSGTRARVRAVDAPGGGWLATDHLHRASDVDTMTARQLSFSAAERQYRPRQASLARPVGPLQTRRCGLKLKWFVGVDWGTQKHQACVVDADGEVIGERAFEHGGEGLSAMADWLLSVTDSSTASGIASRRLARRTTGKNNCR